MTLTEIKAAVDAGQTVHWANEGYTATKDRFGQYQIVFAANGSTIGLTWKDGVTMNGKPEDFFLA